MNWIIAVVYVIGFTFSFWRFARVKVEGTYSDGTRFAGRLVMSLFWPVFWLIIGLYFLMLKAEAEIYKDA